MTLGGVGAGDWIVYGVPPLLLLAAATRTWRQGIRPAAAIFLFALAAWMTHVVIQVRTARQPFPVEARVEAPHRTTLAWPQMKHLDGRAVLQFQAPGVLTWILQGDERILRLTFGFIPEAYEQGTTNGAGFSLQLREGGIIRPIFQRSLRPRQQPGDRGPQQVRVVLPPVTAGAQLELAIDAGESGDASWDWVFLADTHLERSAHFLPEQFPTYSRVPAQVSATLAGLIQRDDATVSLQLHAPAELEYNLDPADRRLAFAYGFLAGAYQQGNATDGARFLAELQAPDGTRRILFDRLLQPLTQAGDRGPQWAEVALPAHAARTRLVLKIDPGTAGNNSWDWTYLSRVSLEP